MRALQLMLMPLRQATGWDEDDRGGTGVGHVAGSELPRARQLHAGLQPQGRAAVSLSCTAGSLLSPML